MEGAQRSMNILSLQGRLDSGPVDIPTRPSLFASSCIPTPLAKRSFFDRYVLRPATNVRESDRATVKDKQSSSEHGPDEDHHRRRSKRRPWAMHHPRRVGKDAHGRQRDKRATQQDPLHQLNLRTYRRHSPCQKVFEIVPKILCNTTLSSRVEIRVFQNLSQHGYGVVVVGY